jgi:hypothetical protein
MEKYPVLFGNDDVFVTPALGGIKLGHVLIMSKNFSYSNFMSVDSKTKKSLFAAKNRLNGATGKNEQLIFFEHGANTACNAGGDRKSVG